MSTERRILWPGHETLPEQFEVTGTRDARGLEVRLTGCFDGGRIEVTQVALRSASLSPRDLAAIQLAGLIHQAAMQMLEFGPLGPLGDRRGEKLSDDELRRVATLYVRQCATWGYPRQAVMETWNLPRATANYWIRRARQIYSLPDY